MAEDQETGTNPNSPGESEPQTKPSKKVAKTGRRGPSTRLRRWAFRLILISCMGAFFSLCFLGVLEILARNYFAGTFGFFKHDPQLGWSFVPGREADAVVASGQGKFTKQKVRINSNGLRDREIPYENTEGRRRLLFVGDSMVEAMQVPLEAGFTKLVERALNEKSEANRAFDVINGGNGNYGTDQEYLFYKTVGRQYKPDVVVLFILPLNDFSDNHPDLNDRAYFAKTFFKIENGRLVPRDAPLLPIPVQKLRETNWFVRFASGFQSYNLSCHYAQSYHKGLSRRLESWGLAKSSATLAPDGSSLFFGIAKTPLDPVWIEAVELTSAIVKAFRDNVEADGARFRVAIVPFNKLFLAAYGEKARDPLPFLFDPDVDLGQPVRLTREFLDKLQIPYLDLTGPMLEAIEKTGKPTNILPDGHPNRFGHEVAAKAILKFLESLGDL